MTSGGAGARGGASGALRGAVRSDLVRRQGRSVKETLAASYRRWRGSALPIVQCAVAAGLAWWIATAVIGHAQPFFAPVAAVVSLGLSLGARMRRSFELVGGVTIGIGVGDLLISLIGSGPWQIALVLTLAMSVAVLINSGPIFSMQAGNSAVLVATLLPPGGSGGFDRMIDALVGGLVGIAVVALIPTHPVGRLRIALAAVVQSGGDVLRLVEKGLVENDPAPIKDALKKARGTQPAIDSMRTHLRSGQEITRISPLYWSARPRLARIVKVVDPMDNAMRNIRVLARRSLSLVRDDEILDPRLVGIIEDVADALEVLRAMALADDGQQPDQAEAARVLRTVAKKLSPELVEGAGLSATVVFAQLRSLVVDLLQVAGLSRISAVATLPPTSEHPFYQPESKD